MNPTVEKSSARSIDVSYKSYSRKVIYPNSVIKETMYIDLEKMAHVVGKAMSNVNRLAKLHDVEVTLPVKGSSPKIIIEGLAEDVFAAKRDIEESIPLTMSFFIDKYYTPVVIGPEGKNIKFISKAYNVEIGVRKDGQVLVSGKKRNCEAAMKNIEFNISQRKTAENYKCAEKFSVPAVLIPHVAGKAGSNVKRIESTYTVRVFLQIKNDQTGEIVVKGPSAGKVSAAKKDILDKLGLGSCQEKFSVPAHLLGYVCGKDGSNAKRIQSYYNVNVFLPPRDGPSDEILVTGPTTESVSAAKKDILESVLPKMTSSLVVDDLVW